MFTVNSGVGLEALLHQKRVYTFGNADYANAAEKIIFGGSLKNASEAIDSILSNLIMINADLKHQNSVSFINA